MTGSPVFSVNFTNQKIQLILTITCQLRKVKQSWNAFKISSIAFGLRCSQKTKPCFVTLRNFFSLTAEVLKSRSVEVLKTLNGWQSYILSKFCLTFLIDIWYFGLAVFFRFVKFTANIGLPVIKCFENLDRLSSWKKFKVSQNMVSSSEPSINKMLDLKSIKHFRIAWLFLIDTW